MQKAAFFFSQLDYVSVLAIAVLQVSAFYYLFKTFRKSHLLSDRRKKVCAYNCGDFGKRRNFVFPIIDSVPSVCLQA